MGSDLYMESQSFRPRPTKVEWISPTVLRVQRDYFYDGYKTEYEGEVTPETRPVIEAFVGTIPPKPKQYPGELKRGNRVKVSFDGSVMTADDETVKVRVRVNGTVFHAIVPRNSISLKES